MNQFNFKSQICTDINQSERLLALGLKKETADMSHTAIVINRKVQYMEHCSTPKGMDIPAWSLHRLWELGKFMGIHLSSEVSISNLYEYAIARIEKQIKEGYFNKEYLEE